MNDYYTAAQAIKRLELPRSTFYYLVETGQIPKEQIPLRKQAFYPKKAIDALARERNLTDKDFQDKPERWAFVIPTRADLDQLIEIEHTIWGEVGIISPDNIMARYPYNPECIHVLKDKQSDKVVGSITMSPLAENRIEQLISFQADESDLQPSDYLPFAETTQDCYVVSIVACQDMYSTSYAALLLRDTGQFLMQLAEQGKLVRRVYTVATTDDGERLCRKFGFKEIGQGIGPLGDSRKAFVLDLEQKQPSLEMVKAYQSIVKNRKRREQRQRKQIAEPNATLPAESDWVRLEDLPYVLALDYEVYGPENSVDTSVTRTWWKKNPYACRILYNATNRRDIWGALTILPMKEEEILKVLHGEKTEHEITAADIFAYEAGRNYVGYVASAIIRPEHRWQFRQLMQGIVDFWCEHYPDIEMQKLYAIGFSNEGTMLIQQLYFAPRYDLGPNAFELDLRKLSHSRLVRSYQECISTKQPVIDEK